MVIFSDEDIVIANKACGKAAQPGPGAENSLLEELSQDFGELYPVHRLDMPVSGIIVFARTSAAAANLSEQFRTSSVQKTYICAVDNPPPAESGRLENHLHIPSGKKANKVYIRTEAGSGTKKAVLDYKQIYKTDRYYILEISLKTGRKHQIRAQLSNIGCHVKGDIKYGSRRTNRGGGIHLHALSLSFLHPRTGEELSFTAPLPQDAVWNTVCSETGLPSCLEQKNNK